MKRLGPSNPVIYFILSELSREYLLDINENDGKNESDSD